ncbi:MAG: recombinase family protein [Candidatus Marinimicrobia bacterium]|nr:recombinase family protein [Candidatus Neomarinimicrobiota bacterium]
MTDSFAACRKTSILVLREEQLIFHVFGALAEFERDIIRERTLAGLAAARARGNIGGRPRLMNEWKISLAKAPLDDDSNTVEDLCKTLGVSRATLYQ